MNNVIEARGTGFIALVRAVEAEGSFVSRVTVRGNGVYECRVTRGQTQPFTHSNAQEGHVAARGGALGEEGRGPVNKESFADHSTVGLSNSTPKNESD